ncbi:MAG: hypothetical protein ABIR56_15985, partial [Polaromonas sp.]
MMGSLRIQPTDKEVAMRISSIYPIVGATLLAFSQMSLAEDASVMITSPADGARLDAMAQNQLV